jgi:hypothetical protein
LNSLSTHRGIFPAAAFEWNRIAGHVILVLAAIVLAGCATTKPRTAQEIVKERAQARWDAVVKGDSKTAYDYLSPGSRAVITAEAYDASLRKGFWKSAVVEGVECASEQSCEAIVAIEYEYMGRRTRTPLREAWVRTGSEWWYLRK